MEKHQSSLSDSSAETKVGSLEQTIHDSPDNTKIGSLEQTIHDSPDNTKFGSLEQTIHDSPGKTNIGSLEQTIQDSPDLEQTIHDSPDKTNIGSLEQTIDNTLKNEEPKEFQEAAQQVNSCVDLNDYSKASLFPIIGRYHHCVLPESDDHCREILQYQKNLVVKLNAAQQVNSCVALNAGSEVEEPCCVLTDSEGNFHYIRDSDSDGIFECFLLDSYDTCLGTMRFKCPADYNAHKPSGEPIRNCLSEEETTQFQPNAISTADKTYAEPIKKTACLDSPLRQFWLKMARNVWKRAKEVLRILREQRKWPRGLPEKIKSLCAECSRPTDGSLTPQQEKQLFYDTYGGRNSRNLYYPPSSSTLANFSKSQLFRDAARRPNFNLYFPPSSSTIAHFSNSSHPNSQDYEKLQTELKVLKERMKEMGAMQQRMKDIENLLARMADNQNQ